MRTVVRAEQNKAESLTNQAESAFKEAVETVSSEVAEANSVVEEVNQENNPYAAASGMTEFDEAIAEVGPVADALRFKAMPEIINGRLSMIGITTALAAEALSGSNLFDQIGMAPGPILSVFGLIIAASLIPVVKGASERKPTKFGPITWTPEAELSNGRIAMLAFATLVLVDGARWMVALQSAKTAAMMAAGAH